MSPQMTISIGYVWDVNGEHFEIEGLAREVIQLIIEFVSGGRNPIAGEARGEPLLMLRETSLVAVYVSSLRRLRAERRFIVRRLKF
jgi:hypothetical protein